MTFPIHFLLPLLREWNETNTGDPCPSPSAAARHSSRYSTCRRQSGFTGIARFELGATSQPGEQFHWCLLRRNGVELMLNTAYDDGRRPPLAHPARVAAHGDTGLFFGCPNLKEAYEQLRTAGVNVKPPQMQRYGMMRMELGGPGRVLLVLPVAHAEPDAATTTPTHPEDELKALPHRCCNTMEKMREPDQRRIGKGADRSRRHLILKVAFFRPAPSHIPDIARVWRGCRSRRRGRVHGRFFVCGSYTRDKHRDGAGGYRTSRER